MLVTYCACVDHFYYYYSNIIIIIIIVVIIIIIIIIITIISYLTSPSVTNFRHFVYKQHLPIFVTLSSLTDEDPGLGRNV